MEWQLICKFYRGTIPKNLKIILTTRCWTDTQVGSLVNQTYKVPPKHHHRLQQSPCRSPISGTSCGVTKRWVVYTPKRSIRDESCKLWRPDINPAVWPVCIGGDAEIRSRILFITDIDDSSSANLTPRCWRHGAAWRNLSKYSTAGARFCHMLRVFKLQPERLRNDVMVLTTTLLSHSINAIDHDSRDGS